MGPWGALESPGGSPRTLGGVPWGPLGSPGAPRGCLGCLFGDPWGDLGDPRESLGRPRGAPGEFLGRFWVSKGMQKLESLDFKIDEKPMVLIVYLKLWVAKRPQRKRSKTKPNTGDIIESLGGYFGSPWGHLGGRLVVLGAPLGVLGELLGTTWGHLGHGRVDREVTIRARPRRTWPHILLYS